MSAIRGPGGRFVAGVALRQFDHPIRLEIEDIDVSTVAITDINGNPVIIEAEDHPVGYGETYLMVKFDRADVQDNSPPGDATIAVSGKLTDGTAFEGSDTIRVINPA